jgi:MoxR-like ATPase
MSQVAFVGRERELATLDGWLRAASRGQGGLVLIDGEPGLGKTTLAAEVARSARAAGMRAGWGTWRRRRSSSGPRSWPA